MSAAWTGAGQPNPACVYHISHTSNECSFIYRYLCTCMRSWFFLSSSCWQLSSATLRSLLRRFFCASARRLVSVSSSAPSSATLASILAAAFLPLARALRSASSSLEAASLTWASSSLASPSSTAPLLRPQLRSQPRGLHHRPLRFVLGLPHLRTH